MKIKSYLSMLLFLTEMVAFCQQVDRAYNINIAFSHFAGKALLQLDSTYVNPFEESYTITQFKYYISNISFADSTGKETTVSNKCFLIDEKNPDSKLLTLTTTTDNIKAIHFYIGIDSTRNMNGIDTGALDPANGMYWTWSSGYIMAKLEAISPLSKAPMHKVSYHIGGNEKDYNTTKKIVRSFPQTINIKKENNIKIQITADINKWFNGIHPVRIADTNTCMNPGQLAGKIAENYATMFGISNYEKYQCENN